MLNIKSTDKVLEIGSGNRPRERSDVLCDKFIDDNYQRALSENIVIDKRPFVVADGLALPFKDHSFDYVITSHILEHVDDPLKFVSELTRVASAGYIETPSELGEMLLGWPFHKWIVRLENNTIIMRRRKRDSPFGDYFHQMYQKDLLFAEFVDSHFDDFYVQYEWQGTINLRIEDDDEFFVKLNDGSIKGDLTKSKVKTYTILIIYKLLNPLLRFLRYLRRFG